MLQIRAIHIVKGCMELPDFDKENPRHFFEAYFDVTTPSTDSDKVR